MSTAPKFQESETDANSTCSMISSYPQLTMYYALATVSASQFAIKRPVGVNDLIYLYQTVRIFYVSSMNVGHVY
jgi:hypothetical protein